MASEIEPVLRRHILQIVETYCKATGFKVSGVSRRAHGDAGFFDLLKDQERKHRKFGHRTDNKGSFTLRVYDQLISWFTANWPPDTDFPALADLSHTERNQDGKTKGKQKQAEGPECGEARQDEGESQARPQAEGGGATSILAKLRRTVGE